VRKLLFIKLACALLIALATPAVADPLRCDLSGYKPIAGITATTTPNDLTVLWDGDRGQQVRLRLVIVDGTPTIQELAIHRATGAWAPLLVNVVPDFRVVSGLRRISNQQLAPLRGLGVELTPAVVDKYRWEPFWDAPLDLSTPSGRGGNPPPAEGVANSPGLPRKPEEITRASAVYRAVGCAVKSEGVRIDVSFPGVQLGVFSGTLRFSMFKGTNLIQQEVLASTARPWVAYKYDAGLRNVPIAASSRVGWRDTGNAWKEYLLNGLVDQHDVALKTSGRIVVADRGAAGSLALFPPPHNFFWAREIAVNLGYNFYRKDSDKTFSLGIRQAEHEDESENQANFALYSARPGSTQRLTVYLYPNADGGQATQAAALAFTHGDHYQPLAGYQVMNHHYHMDLGQRLGQANSLDAAIPDLVALKALGINIVSQIDSVGGSESTPEGAVYPGARPVAGRGAGPGAAPAAAAGRGRSGDQLQIRYNSIEGAKRHSDPTFLIMPSQEYYGSPLGGHTDLLFSHPVYWTAGRALGQPLTDPDPKYGTVYHLGDAADLMEMARRENVLINMPHPRTKGSTGYPDSIKDLPFFSDPHYQGVGFRWGMGLDRSEQRLCEYRCQPLFDDMNNWVADKPIPPKYILSISEVRHQQPGDEIYASAPVTYVKLAALPTGEDHGAIIQALMRGESFVTSGEVLMASWSVNGTGRQRTVSIDLAWTFPLDFVEVISGDGTRTERKVVPVSDQPAMGSHHFEIPFDAAGKKWVRVAGWDIAGDGAMSQPLKLQ
jgi:hypothetical protein